MAIISFILAASVTYNFYQHNKSKEKHKLYQENLIKFHESYKSDMEQCALTIGNLQVEIHECREENKPAT